VSNDQTDRERQALPSVRPYSSTWVRYYDQASRRRHRNGGYKRLRAEAKRKRRREIITFVAGGVSVLAIMGICYLVLLLRAS
jgi:hypothetical protein